MYYIQIAYRELAYSHAFVLRISKHCEAFALTWFTDVERQLNNSSGTDFLISLQIHSIEMTRIIFPKENFRKNTLEVS